MTDAEYFRKIALRPTLAAICQQIFNAGFDCRNQFAARQVLSARDLGYWDEFIACALPSDWLIWAAEDCISHHMKIEMMEYYRKALKPTLQDFYNAMAAWIDQSSPEDHTFTFKYGMAGNLAKWSNRKASLYLELMKELDNKDILDTPGIIKWIKEHRTQ